MLSHLLLNSPGTNQMFSEQFVCSQRDAVCQEKAGDMPALYRSDCETFGADVSNSVSAWEERELAEEGPCRECVGCVGPNAVRAGSVFIHAFSPVSYFGILPS